MYVCVAQIRLITSPLRRSGVDHTVLPANTPHLPSPRGWEPANPGSPGTFPLTKR